MELQDKNYSAEQLKQLIEDWESDKLIRFYTGYKLDPRFQTNMFDIPQKQKHDAFYLVNTEMGRRNIGQIRDLK